MKFSEYVTARNEGKITNMAKKAIFAGVALASIGGKAQETNPPPKEIAKTRQQDIEQLLEKPRSQLTDEEKTKLGWKFLSKEKEQRIKKAWEKRSKEQSERNRKAAERIEKEKLKQK